MNACPCCGCLTLPTRNDYEICPVCFWEDDGYEGEEIGANYVTLKQARANFIEFGAVEKRLVKHTRKPTADEVPQDRRPTEDTER